MLLSRYHERVARIELPAPSAKKADWVAYAEQEGVSVEGLKRDEIVALFPVEGSAEETPEEATAEETTVDASDESVAEADGSTETE